ERDSGRNRFSPQYDRGGSGTISFGRSDAFARGHPWTRLVADAGLSGSGLPDSDLEQPTQYLSRTECDFSGLISAAFGYNSSVGLTCTAGSTQPPPGCTPSPANL